MACCLSVDARRRVRLVAPSAVVAEGEPLREGQRYAILDVHTPRLLCARRFRTILLATLVLAVCLPRAVSALEIDRVIWGFDGQVVSNRFNLLSLLVTNSSPTAFDGSLELRKLSGPQRVDAPLIEDLYLAPHSSRWVQLYPYAKDQWEDWALSWGPQTAGETTLPKPAQGPPACVLLEDPEALPVVGGAIRRFPANLFPVQVTATDGLRAVVLDYTPRWEEARQRAFLDWVRRGGRVHLFYDSRGEWPRFSGLLSVLDSPGDRRRVGSGGVTRHPRRRAELTPLYFEKVLLTDRAPGEVSENEKADDKKPSIDGDKLNDSLSFAGAEWERDDLLMTTLKKMSRPSHSWLLIHLLSLVYLLLVFPGGYILGQKRAGDYRYVFGALLSLVGLFSLLFLIIGRRGHGESTAAQTVAYATALEPGRYDVTGWCDAFAVTGGDYTFTHDGTGRLYSTCQDQEAVRGVIRAGAQAGLTADLPPFSSRTFGFRTLANGPAIAPAIERIERTSQMRQETVTLRDYSTINTPPRSELILQKLVLTKGPQFPTEHKQLHALYGRYLYVLAERDDKLELRQELGSLATHFRLGQSNMLNSFYDPWERMEGTRDELFASLAAPVLARSLGLRGQNDVIDFRLPDDRVRLLIYAPMPESFRLKSDVFRNQQGYVLYSADVFLAETP